MVERHRGPGGHLMKRDFAACQAQDLIQEDLAIGLARQGRMFELVLVQLGQGPQFDRREVWPAFGFRHAHVLQALRPPNARFQPRRLIIPLAAIGCKSLLGRNARREKKSTR